jgi:hypothetical protein
MRPLAVALALLLAATAVAQSALDSFDAFRRARASPTNWCAAMSMVRRRLPLL